ncbi:hypothetical protein C8R44DRAFT_767940 [Mycena epipterygia]|nr:hypothetical protein C8R44DRAFT_767940 [Mycena epipterygia]
MPSLPQVSSTSGPTCAILASKRRLILAGEDRCLIQTSCAEPLPFDWITGTL